MSNVAVCIAAVLMLITLLFVPRFFGPRPQAASTRRFKNALHIGNALYHYREDHDGALPKRLSELVPDYVAYSNMNWFFWPPKRDVAAQTPARAAEIANLIDDEGAFVYLQRRGSREDLVLYERTELWPKEPLGDVVTTLTTNLITRCRSVQDVSDRLANLGPRD